MDYKFKDQSTPFQKRVEIVDENGKAYNYRHVIEGDIVGDVTVSIDMDAIVRSMGRKALKSKTRACRDGFVVVKARNVRRVP